MATAQREGRAAPGQVSSPTLAAGYSRTMEAQYLTVQDAAKRLRLHANTIRACCKDGRFEGATRIGGRWRIPESTIDAALERGMPRHRIKSGVIQPGRESNRELGRWE